MNLVVLGFSKDGLELSSVALLNHQLRALAPQVVDDSSKKFGCRKDGVRKSYPEKQIFERPQSHLVNPQLGTQHKCTKWDPGRHWNPQTQNCESLHMCPLSILQVPYPPSPSPNLCSEVSQGVERWCRQVRSLSMKIWPRESRCVPKFPPISPEKYDVPAASSVSRVVVYV